MNTTATISPEDARTGAAFAALLADGDLDAALALHDDPVTLAATMILGQHLEAYVEALSSGHHSIAWPVIAHELRGTIATISERETNSSPRGTAGYRESSRRHRQGEPAGRALVARLSTRPSSRLRRL